jgi:hypothetical protein
MFSRYCCSTFSGGSGGGATGTLRQRGVSILVGNALCGSAGDFPLDLAGAGGVERRGVRDIWCYTALELE